MPIQANHSFQPAAVNKMSDVPRRAHIPLNDTFEIAETQGINEKWKRKRNFLRIWQESLLASEGISLDIDYTLPVQSPSADAKKVAPASVFLTALISGIAVMDDDGYILPLDTDAILKDEIASMTGVVAMYGHIAIRHQIIDGQEKISAHGLVGDLYSDQAKTDADYVQNVAMEYMRAALVMVEEAQLNGLTSINFGNTVDPVKRYVLKCACWELGIDCSSEHVDEDAIPRDTPYKDRILDVLFSALEDHRTKPRAQIIFRPNTSKFAANAPNSQQFQHP